MGEIILNDAFFQETAGWEAVKLARGILAEGRVLSSSYKPPLLQGVVQAGDISYRAGLAIRSVADIDNLCHCRQSRDLGALCPHSVAVGLHWIKPAAPKPGAGKKPISPVKDPVRLARDAGAERLLISVILPPRLNESLEHGRVMVVAEGERGGRRAPLNAWMREGPASLSAEDATLLDRLEELCGGDTPAVAQISRDDFLRILPALAGHPRVALGRGRAFHISAQPEPWPIRARLEANGEITLSVDPPRPPVSWLSGSGRVWALRVPAEPGAPATLGPLALPAVAEKAAQRPVRIGRQEAPLFLSRDWPALAAAGPVDANFTLADFILDAQAPRVRLELDGGAALMTARLAFIYGARVILSGVQASPADVWMPDPANPRRYGLRDLSAEQDAVARLRQTGFSGPDDRGQWKLTGADPVASFFGRELPRLKKRWEVTLEERLDRSARTHFEIVAPSFRVQPSGEQWFDLEVSYRSQGGEPLSAAEIELLLRGGGSRRLRSGRIAILDSVAVEEFREALRDCAPEQRVDGGSARYRIADSEAGFLEASLRDQGMGFDAPKAWRDKTAALRGEVRPECPALGPLDTVLRPYQKAGVAWLAHLRNQGWGGLLADDMGLGKTLQTLAHLDVLYRGKGPEAKPSLVVCPTSLVFNWCAEAARFTPQLRTVILAGPDRDRRFSEIPGAQLAITSYALLRRDVERYAPLEFDTVILDEAQHIKNRGSQNARSVKALASRRRLALTGTPLENSALDLWSLFDFLMPGYLGTAPDFRERYEIPIAKHNDVASLARLGRKLRPFMLRRLKTEVAKDLPPRIDQVILCDLTEPQSALYQQLLLAARREVLEADDKNQRRMAALTALLRLRQICCDPRLLPGAQTTGGPDPGGKFDQFIELLDEILDGGHRTLVFSQFTTMLGLLKGHLDEAKIPYCYLDGSTVDRAAVVQRFQSDEKTPVFLISLKAGGVGLNLTGADTVIHFDPWWNPAVEDQATDRAHRIGQTRVVTSYKLIARGTVEEKILNLQRRKRELAAAALSGEEALTSALTWDEIRELLA